MAKSGITVDASQAIRFLKNADSKTKRNVNAAIGAAGLLVEADVKLSISGQKAEKRSVDTGRFLQSVSTNISPFVAVVSSNVEYAKFLEFGTTRIVARSHFKNTATRDRPKVIALVQKAVNKSVK